MKQWICSLAVAALLFGAACTPESDKPGEAASIAPSELSSLVTAGTAPLIVDVRTSAEFAAGHIPGAVNVPFDEVANRITEFETPNGVALYCLAGPRARRGEAALLESGYTSVLHIDGGFSAWQEAGLPVERGE